MYWKLTHWYNTFSFLLGITFSTTLTFLCSENFSVNKRKKILCFWHTHKINWYGLTLLHSKKKKGSEITWYFFICNECSIFQEYFYKDISFFKNKYHKLKLIFIVVMISLAYKIQKLNENFPFNIKFDKKKKKF
jgi:hypothetical protein